MADPSTLFGVDLKSIRTRLSALEYFTSVQDIQASGQAIQGIKAFIPPAAFVSVASETYERNRYASGGHGQRATPIISVLFCVPAARADDNLGDEVEQARKVILAQLTGWKPTGALLGLEAVRYQVRQMDEFMIWAEWLFRTEYDLRAN